jgi:hypothetical protein
VFASVSGDFLKIEMADLKERAHVKFCFLLEETAVETVMMLKEVLRMKAWV